MIVFEKAGKLNTDETIRIALDEAAKRGIRHIVVASYTGFTAQKLFDHPELNIVVVRGTYGFHATEGGGIRMSDDVYQTLLNQGMKVVTAAHALSGAERSLSTASKGVYPVEVIAHTLRMLGQGTKVCVECAAMACDNGAIPAGEPVIAIAGTAEGADTAVILKAANTHRILDTRICEYLCKPNL